MNKAVDQIKKIVLEHNIKGKIEFNYNLSKLSWFGVAGKAEIFYVPDSSYELALLLKLLSPKINRTVIGMGSNLLIRDGGIDGIVIKLGKNFSNIILEKNAVSIGASVPDKVLSRFCLSESINGFEFLTGIPGNIGGAVAMNAGCYGSEIKDVFLSADCIDYLGNEVSIDKSENFFSYRNNSRVRDLIIMNVKFKKVKGNKKQITDKMEEINNNRILSQPQKVRTAGSTFKNPISNSNKKAWELIELSGSRDIKVNNISLSDEHANFIVNKQFASANDIESFGESIKERVLSKTGVSLEWEIRILGKYE
jgi:UDP-N-acetylmuramate dehydrogenase